MTTTTTARRTVNAYILRRYPTSFGTHYAARGGGAWGRPEDAYAAAKARAGFDSWSGRVIGISIVDVETGEEWNVLL